MPILPKLHYLDLTANPFLLSVFIWFLVRFCLLVCVVLSYCLPEILCGYWQENQYSMASLQRKYAHDFVRQLG